MTPTIPIREPSPDATAPATRGRTRALPSPSVLLAALALVVTAPAASEAQFSVRPVIHHYPAGSAATRELTVKNEADVTRQLRIYVADFDRDRAGEHSFLAAGEHERSCAGRMEVFPDQLVLDPGEAADVRITMQPAARTCWSVVFAETVEGSEKGVRIGRRIGAKVFGHGHGAEEDVSVDAVEASPAGDSVDVRFTVENTGGLPVRPEGTVEVRTVTGEVVGRRSLRPFGVLPGHGREVQVTVPASLGSERYLAVPILDTGGDHLIGGQASFRVPARTASSAGGR